MGDGAEQTPAAKLADLVLGEAFKRRSTGLYVDPTRRGTVVTVRTRGQLEEVNKFPNGVHAEVVAELKRRVGIDPDSRGPAQRGRGFAQIEGVTVDLQLASFPSIYGEALTLNVVGLDAEIPSLEDVFRPDALDGFRAALRPRSGMRNPFGLVLVAGPTASGKNTTLYAMLNDLKRPDLRIMTMEDSVHVYVEGAVQGFATPEFTVEDGIRAMFASDPDVCLVETLATTSVARLALDLARTGRLVLTTVHADDIVSAISTLAHLAEQPLTAVVDALAFVSAQRLIARSCPHCRAERAATEAELTELGLGVGGQGVTTNRGCELCDRTGRLGRRAIVEFARGTPALVAAAGTGDSRSMRRALGPSFRTMDDDLRDQTVAGAIAVDTALDYFAGRHELSAALDALVHDIEAARPEIKVAALDGTVTIVFTDIVGSTSLTAAVGDAAWLDALRQHQAMVRKKTEEWGGVEVKAEGDGFMLAFPSSGSAVRCALAIQDEADSVVLDNGEALAVKIGMHAGEPIRDGDDFYGTTVNIAARVAAAAGPGEVLVSPLVHGLLSTGKDISFGEPRERELKGIEGHQILYPVHAGPG